MNMRNYDVRDRYKNKKVITKRDIKKLKLYKTNKYPNKFIYKKRKFIKKFILYLALGGTVVLCCKNLFKVEAEVVDKEPVSSSLNSEDNEESEIEQNNNYDYFAVGSSRDNYKVIDFLYGPSGQFIYKYSEMYGVDPNIIASMCMQESSLMHMECIPGGDMYYGYGVGIMQLESPAGQEVSAYNYLTGEYDTEYITMENACSIETNIKIGCMIFQNSLENNNGNIFLAIQSHNYGQPMLDLILEEEYQDKITNVKSDYENVEWLKYIKEAHENPGKYLFNWGEDKYGDGNYIANVLRFCPINISKYKYDGCEYTFDLKNRKVIKVDKLENRTK